MPRTAIHLHLPRARAGDPAKWSVKTGLEPTVYLERALLLPGDAPVRFTVAPAAHRDYLESGQRNVFAYARGELAPDWVAVAVSPEGGRPPMFVEIVFDAEAGEFKTAGFYGDGSVVTGARAAYFADAMYALEPQP